MIRDGREETGKREPEQEEDIDKDVQKTGDRELLQQ